MIAWDSWQIRYLLDRLEWRRSLTDPLYERRRAALLAAEATSIRRLVETSRSNVVASASGEGSPHDPEETTR